MQIEILITMCDLKSLGVCPVDATAPEPFSYMKNIVYLYLCANAF